MEKVFMLTVMDKKEKVYGNKGNEFNGSIEINFYLYDLLFESV